VTNWGEVIRRERALITERAMFIAPALLIAVLLAACSNNGDAVASKPSPGALKPAPVTSARPGFAKRRALVAQGKVAFAGGDWDTCARLFETAHSWSDAARCVAHTRDTTRGLEDMQRALTVGWHDLDKLCSDPDLAPLQRDPRWQPILADATGRLTAYRGRVNVELEQLARAEEPAGQPTGQPQAHPSASVFAARRDRVAEILAAGSATLPEDYLHAAAVYYRADTAADATRAHELALTALEREPDSDEAKWLAAAAEDRRLKHEGKPQKYGTQFVTRNGKRSLWNVDPSISDAERERWSVPSLAEAIAGDAETTAALRMGEPTL
jgi:hypothetical protein